MSDLEYPILNAHKTTNTLTQGQLNDFKTYQRYPKQQKQKVIKASKYWNYDQGDS